MTSREKYMAALEHRKTDELAFSWGFGPQPPALAELNAHLKQWDLNFEKLYLLTSDERHIEVPHIGDKLPQNQSIWGYTTKPVSYGEGYYDEIDYYPLAEAEDLGDIELYSWPDPHAYDFKSIEASIRSCDPNREYATIIRGGNPFEILTWTMGMEKTLICLLTQPEIIHSAMRRITDFFLTKTELALQAAKGKIDVVFCADDLGTQIGPMISIETYRNLIKPYHAELYSMIHQYGAKVMHHSDGSVFALLDDLIDAGVDCLEAVQIECADMQPETLKKHVGNRLAFRGAISVQQVLPKCSPEQVRAEVMRLKEILGKNGGYICAPSHAIQAGTPPENIVAMIEAVTKKNINQFAGP